MPPMPREKELFVSERPVQSDFGRSDFGRADTGRSDKGRQRAYARRRHITLAVLVLIVCGIVHFASNHSPSSPATVPTIKAEGDYKQKPENPGGIDIPHQDVEIYKKFENKTTEPAGVEHLLPPPETPQDVPHALTHVEKSAPLGPNAVTPTVDKAVVDKTLPEASTLPAALPTIDKNAVPVAEVPTAKSSTPPPLIKSSATDAILDGAKNSKNVATTVTPSALPAVGVAPSPSPTSPLMAPDQTTTAENKSTPQSINDLLKREDANDAPVKAPVKETVVKPASPSASTSISPVSGTGASSTAASGTVAVQLASVPDQAQAQSLLQNLGQKYAGELSGVTLRLARADLGARGVYYRIQGQNLSEEAATHICAALKKKNAGCILVRQ